MPARNLGELRGRPCKEDPVDYCRDPLHPSLEHAPPLFDTIRRQAYSSVQHLRHLRIFVPVQLGRRGYPLRPPSCTTSTPLEGPWFRTNCFHRRSPARTGLPSHLVRQPVASTVRPQMG